LREKVAQRKKFPFTGPRKQANTIKRATTETEKGKRRIRCRKKWRGRT